MRRFGANACISTLLLLATAGQASQTACRKLSQHDQTWILSALTFSEKNSQGVSKSDLHDLVKSIEMDKFVNIDSWFRSSLSDLKADSRAHHIPGLSVHESTVDSLRQLGPSIRCQVLLQAYQSGSLTFQGIKKELGESKRLKLIDESPRLKAIMAAMDEISREAEVLQVPVAQLVSIYTIYPQLRPPIRDVMDKSAEAHAASEELDQDIFAGGDGEL